MYCLLPYGYPGIRCTIDDHKFTMRRIIMIESKEIRMVIVSIRIHCIRIFRFKALVVTRGRIICSFADKIISTRKAYVA